MKGRQEGVAWFNGGGRRFGGFGVLGVTGFRECVRGFTGLGEAGYVVSRFRFTGFKGGVREAEKQIDTRCQIGGMPMFISVMFWT